VTYTLADSFYSPYFFFIFFIQIIPILFAVYYPLYKRFPLDYSIKHILSLVSTNILFCYICSVILFHFFHCIMVYYITVLFFCFFQYLFFQMRWIKKKTPYITIYFAATLLINVILLSCKIDDQWYFFHHLDQCCGCYRYILSVLEILHA